MSRLGPALWVSLVVVLFELSTQAADSPDKGAYPRLYLAKILSLEHLQGLNVKIVPSTCDRRYVVTAPQYGIYIGRAAGNTLQETQYCPSAQICSGELLPGSAQDLVLMSAVRVAKAEGSPGFQVALQISGTLCSSP